MQASATPLCERVSHRGSRDRFSSFRPLRRAERPPKLIHDKLRCASAAQRSAAERSGAERSGAMSDIPNWHILGDWFDNCSCAVACPCTFAQAPDNGFCESVLFWHIRKGHYGEINLDGLSFVRVGRWEGDLWAGKAKGSAGIFLDDRADERQAEVLP